ncbi:basic amino acid ABC transporter substrate-binding protein [Fictibacillus norfolkensis]|uniref:Basic amino acid ABC transporter substrate-binding protein n=1 Tax=Fictibacillus norfolkensis TaxID=2762233 RepID=A0ABR8SHI7_9BACL|nr:basic amino acid ABC transporter substrate-binding protein [Fictibacillus norfolkensis]MBD7962579.1 basic amino acid ABC transporter substrate-binding protein [Fictibacillus norfolkensis]
MKRKFKMGLIGLSAAFLVACGSADSGSGSGEKLTVGTDAAYAPFESLDGEKIVGFDVDLLDAVMKEAGLDYELTNKGWDPLFIALQNEEVDAGISAITINDDRKKSYDFSSPYFESINMILAKQGTSIKSAKDLEGMKVSVQNGTTGQAALEKMFGKSENIKKYENNVLAIQALLNGEVEAVVADNAVVQEYEKNNPDKKLVTISDKENFESEFYGIIFPKDGEHQEEINKAMKKIIDDGKYAEIYKKWFGEEPNVDVLKQ